MKLMHVVVNKLKLHKMKLSESKLFWLFAESSGVLWRDFGGSVTIQCRPSEQDQKILSLKKGLREDDVVAIGEKSKINSIDAEFKDRLQLNGAFPSVDILITNLTFNDTGPFWCVYTKFDKNLKQVKQQKSKGSVLDRKSVV